MVEARSLYVEGYFDEEDWMGLLGVLRIVEQKHSNRDYKAFILEGVPPMSVEESIEFLKRTLPERPGRKVTTIFKR